MANDAKGNPSITIEGQQIPIATYRSLLEYILKNIRNGVDRKTINQQLVQAGWNERVIAFLYDAGFLASEKFSGSRESSGSDQQTSEHKGAINKLETELQNAIKQFDKFEGKLESEEGKLSNYEEKMNMLRDMVNETRGSVMSIEKRISEFEMKIEKVNSIIAEYDPEVLEKKFADIEKQFNMKDSEISKTNAKLEQIEHSLNEYLDFMRKIKSQQALLQTLQSLNKKVDAIKESEKNIDRMSGKVQSIFEEMQDKLDVLMKVNSKTESYDDMMRDIIKDIDSLSNRVKTSVSKEDFAKKMNSIQQDMETVKSAVYEVNQKKGLLGRLKSGRKDSENSSEQGSQTQVSAVSSTQQESQNTTPGSQAQGGSSSNQQSQNAQQQPQQESPGQSGRSSNQQQS